MTGKTFRQFLDDLYYNAEIEFTFNGKKYLISAWLHADKSYILLYIQSKKFRKKYFAVRLFLVKKLLQSLNLPKFLTAKLFMTLKKILP